MSPGSNPFASSNDGDDIQLEDFPSVRVYAPRSPSPIPKFVSEHPSRSGRDLGRSLTGNTLRTQLDNDLAVSDWETVAADEEFKESTAPPRQQHRRRKDAEVLFHAHDILNSSRPNGIPRQRRNTILAPPNFSLPKLPSGASRLAVPKNTSFYSSSSVYSDVGRDEWIDEDQLLDLSAHGPWRAPSRKRRATLGMGRNTGGELVGVCSKTSSSASIDRFKFDGDGYSIFLHSSAERDISQALHQAGMSTDSGGTMTRSNLTSAHNQTVGKPLRHPSFYNHEALQSN